ncbi:hypothetical protein MCOR27_010467 [Pyricularia oryzae]|uniref:Small ribosomal subunit protein uS7 domain-containing protein n=4 Tax=Pyricularia TaxID=48558 RepID=A0ABQ8N8J8_PYRGI|nr:uncharacterized protein MGG_09508 [Pyricularia oryzae 70-15]KAH8847646.1 hypothetical protein MCOR01_011787 [Pyricularia oryzae]KAI6291724.1 hypothetical protein MCOR33_010405 [Pyricularia grisea]EHA52427.1 hypothetical protein MGG_09508 [Pyricularia oryzae 70-15]KAH9430426.1 hypothetical protein MCOR02_010129 [Pyricularia oryzae]KAI6251898.1 hypothetical protein MCOR19_011480 [Pyricularia oryzae]
MPPRLNFLASCRTLVLRPKRPAPASWQPPRALSIIRGYADNITPPPSSSSSSSYPSPAAPESSHIEDDEIVTPLSSLDAARPLHVRPAEAGPDMDNDEALRQLEMISYGVNAFDPQAVGHKYGVPELPIPDGMHLKHRYNPVLDQCTNLLMRDGKKGKAQRDMSMILNFLRTFPAPRRTSAHRLMPGAPPLSHLPLDPVTYFTLAIDSVAPLVKIRNFAGLAGGGVALPIPTPLPVRARRRIAFQWILESVNKKPSKGSGRTQLSHRIAEEIVAIIEGRSSLWEKRMLLHKMGTTARANVQKLTAPRRR